MKLNFFSAGIKPLFIKKDKVLYQIEKKQVIKKVKDTTKDSRKYDIVVLINNSSASASEILASSLKESYLKAKADNYDVSVSAVKANLNESYTVKDIDNICLELAKQQKAINKLPIKLDENTSVKVFSKKEYIGDRKAFDNSDDDVSTLLELIQ